MKRWLIFQKRSSSPRRALWPTLVGAKSSWCRSNWTRRWRILIKLSKLQRVPNDGGAYERRGFAYRSLKKYKEAIADYTKVIATDPKDPDGYRHRAVAYAMAGDNKNAAADLRALLKIKPDDADAQSRLKALEPLANPSAAPAAASPH